MSSLNIQIVSIFYPIVIFPNELQQIGISNEQLIKVKNLPSSENYLKIPVSNLTNGFYIFSVKFNNGNVCGDSFIKK